MAISGVNTNIYNNINTNPYSQGVRKQNETQGINRPVEAKDNADFSKLLQQRQDKKALTVEDYEKIKKEIQELDKNKKPQEVLERRDGFVTRVKNQNDNYDFKIDKNGEKQADIVHLRALKADGYFQPMQDFINDMNGLGEKEKYVLNRAVLTSMENSGTSRDVSRFKSAKLEQNRTELKMMADTVVPEKYKEEFKKRADAYVDQVYRDYVKKMDFASKEENRQFIQKDFLDKIDKERFDKVDIKKYREEFNPVQKLVKEGNYLEAKEKLNSIYKDIFNVGTKDFTTEGMDEFVVSPVVRKMQESWNTALSILNSNFNMQNNFSDMFFSTYFNARG